MEARTLLLILFLPLPALADPDNSYAMIGKPSPHEGVTYVQIRPPTPLNSDTVAELLYWNADVNLPKDTGEYSVTLSPDLTVTIWFEHNDQSTDNDTILVLTTPPGTYAEPPLLTLDEGSSGVIRILPIPNS